MNFSWFMWVNLLCRSKTARRMEAVGHGEAKGMSQQACVDSFPAVVIFLGIETIEGVLGLY